MLLDPLNQEAPASESKNQANSSVALTRRQLREQERAGCVYERDASHDSMLPTRRQMRDAEKVRRGIVAPRVSVREPRVQTPLRRSSFERVSERRSFLTTAHIARYLRTSHLSHSAGSSTRGSSRVRRRFTLTAMVFASGLMVATSLPANALVSPSDLYASYVEGEWKRTKAPTQSLPAKNTANGAVEREGYSATTVAEYAAKTGIRVASGSFVNNPRGTIQWPFPVGVQVGDRFGEYRDCSGCPRNAHQGLDFNPGNGAPIQAIADGVVSYREDSDSGLGVHMIIDHNINGQRVQSVYAHMQHGSMMFREGESVSVGEVIGRVGSTGISTGPHLHFEIRIGGTKVDPLEWLRENTN